MQAQNICATIIGRHKEEIIPAGRDGSKRFCFIRIDDIVQVGVLHPCRENLFAYLVGDTVNRRRCEHMFDLTKPALPICHQALAQYPDSSASRRIFHLPLPSDRTAGAAQVQDFLGANLKTGDRPSLDQCHIRMVYIDERWCFRIIVVIYPILQPGGIPRGVVESEYHAGPACAIDQRHINKF